MEFGRAHFPSVLKHFLVLKNTLESALEEKAAEGQGDWNLIPFWVTETPPYNKALYSEVRLARVRVMSALMWLISAVVLAVTSKLANILR